jgi:hypothetical protein
VFTGDDQSPAASYNPQGALSHNLVELSGSASGSTFNMAPSLAGTLSLRLDPDGPGLWNIDVAAQAYSGQAMPGISMNQFLVAAGSPAAQEPTYKVDGAGNSGTWNADASSNWAIQYSLDFYLAANIDGDPSSDDVDAAFNNTSQKGYLLPVSQLTAAGLAGLSLDNANGFYAGDLQSYLLDQIAPRLPDDATYLLLTQMDKVHPDYAESGLPITTASLLGNLTIAYTTDVVPEPASALMLAGLGAWMMGRRRRRGGRERSIVKGIISAPEEGR